MAIAQSATKVGVLEHLKESGAVKRLVANTGGGSISRPLNSFSLTLIVSTRNQMVGQVQLSGSYVGWFNVYSIAVRIPRLKFSKQSWWPVFQEFYGFEGIACFKFLNRFH